MKPAHTRKTEEAALLGNLRGTDHANDQISWMFTCLWTGAIHQAEIMIYKKSVQRESLVNTQKNCTAASLTCHTALMEFLITVEGFNVSIYMAG